MNYNDLFSSPYLKASDVESKPIVTISKIEQKKMKNQEGVEETKPVLFFRELQKGIVLNRTIANVIAGLYGEDTDEWTGRRVQLVAESVEAFGKRKPAVRVSDQKPPADHAAMLKRYSALFEKAKELGIKDAENYAVPANITDDELVKLGQELRLKVEAAETF